MMIRRTLAAALCALLPLNSAGAHPHIFVEGGLELIFDDQRNLAAVRVVWVYDEFFSLVILEDKGVDPDGDGVLTDAETALLQGFDMNWDQGFEGDLQVLQNAVPLALSRPIESSVRLEGGRLVSTHLRAFETRVAVAGVPVQLQMYDPEYYTAYSFATDPQITGRDGCEAQVFAPDPDEISEELKAAVAELTPTQTLDDLGGDSFPAIGAAYAEEVRITCAP